MKLTNSFKDQETEMTSRVIMLGCDNEVWGHGPFLPFAEDSWDAFRLARKIHSKQVVSCIWLFSEGGVIMAD
jgi:hypothetical protein